ncbi:E3 ubiquitin-protein ligase HECTD3-like [Watersipora subatra]|uniref:E3 ubiquitin-protein ligase HECTD3-like n=1 Tax=Watersipora subatra TaxID=2589382 RepID=UPI00355B113F
MRAQYDSCRTRLGRIRCLNKCLVAFSQQKPFPEALCYTCKNVEFYCSSSYLATHTDITTHSNPFSLPNRGDSESLPDLVLSQSLKDVLPVGTIPCDCNTRFYCSSEPMVTCFGVWLKVFVVKQGSGASAVSQKISPPTWILMHGIANDESPYLEPNDKSHEISSPLAEAWKKDENMNINNWLAYVESQYSMSISSKPIPAPMDLETMAELQRIPENWTAECDEQLIRFLSDAIEINSLNLGTIKNFVDQVTASTSCDHDFEEKLTDGNNETFWESDGNHGQHWIRLKMKSGTVISRLYITIAMDDENYLPEHVVVAGGELDDMAILEDTHIDVTDSAGVKDECVLQDCRKHYPYIEIRIKSCKDEGIDTRIHGLKISSTREVEVGLSVDAFAQRDKLCRYPVLEAYNKEILYRRAQSLQRLVALMDTVLNFLVPSWKESVGALDLIQDVKYLLPLSTKRLTLLDTFIKQSENKDNRLNSNNFPKVIINRRAAAEHRSDPSLDPAAANSVFVQIYEGLKPRNPEDKGLDYRWPGHSTQWWECKLVGEGIIDQGGGFRDSLCDIAEELCPTNTYGQLPLPLFVRAPNQVNADSNMHRDVFVPNPACTKYSQYQWIGKLMGACFRGRESLVLSLPGYIWKRISNEKVKWALDYTSVDAAEVKLLDTLENMDEESFAVHFSERMWAVTLSDGSLSELVPDGANKPLLFADRLEYGRLARERRMMESDKQVNAIKEGFLSVIPEAVLNLMTWQEIEIRICGNPEISIDGLRKSVHLDELDAADDRVKVFWEVMKNFSNEDRSRFLRFVTGRKRLPCPVYISPNKSTAVDCLPESSTCSNTLYLPTYSNVKIAEEKIRYASYNCVAIDTDLNPWEE